MRVTDERAAETQVLLAALRPTAWNNDELTSILADLLADREEWKQLVPPIETLKAIFDSDDLPDPAEWWKQQASAWQREHQKCEAKIARLRRVVEAARKLRFFADGEPDHHANEETYQELSQAIASVDEKEGV